MGEAKGQIEHVFLVLAGGLQRFIPLGIDDDVAGRAGKRALASTLQIDVVAVGDFQHRKPQRRVDLDARAVRLNEGHLGHRLYSPEFLPADGGRWSAAVAVATEASTSSRLRPASAWPLARSMRAWGKGKG